MKHSLTSKLIVSIFAVAIIYLVIAATALTKFGLEDEKQRALEQQEKLIKTVSASASIAAYVGNEDIAAEVGESLLLHPEILSVLIRSNDDFSYQADSSLERDIQADFKERYSYPLFSPVDNLSIGEIQLVLNQELLNEKAYTEVREQTQLLFSQTLLLLIFTFIMIRKIVGQPLKRVASQLSTLRPGDNTKLSLHASHHNDEIGLVTDSVNLFVESSTQALRTERDLREKISYMEKHYRNVLEQAQIGTFVLDHEMKLVKGNEVLFENIEKHLEFTPSDIIGRNLFQLFDEAQGWALSQQVLESQEPQSKEFAVKSRHGETLYVQAVLSVYRGSSPDTYLFEGVIYNVTDRVIKEQHALQLAQVDTLTGLKNRLGCQAFVDSLPVTKPNEASSLAVMLLDLDGFKSINDTHGHAAGDEVLCIVARRVSNQVRKKRDVVSRLGGDEFAVLLSCSDENIDIVNKIARNIISSVSLPIHLKQGDTVSVGVSIGVAFGQGSQFEQSLAKADKAMYHVKKNGKNDVYIAQS
ncbi:diguanylate cyclase [Vibrio aquaticus]|uniref:Diguanylate cyclase n=1 Tax=Vibrio aquaticus TaxID=2496559 RepID=A0A3S0PNK9_9VIBR|nr:sensor domain-containing diguanylate cyclase [Vibrio aquaticus]RTZ15601.1 diguanylate cyclase [Vibrio aquaticus]